ncbi:MAG: phosphate regulon sensor histidine kinase PhoR [Candidatus Nitrotoga sp.]|jgi:two-component system, OmpR family, phosphate regulon sensor histidine kinase PhoR|nr:phosphate regulon sensor histidine kinase PhoR [Candidatus Nitrotoga sp.]MDW7604087.1 phosphate regulon sensor histidine kinase PhoR [Candidatus Nitrotoga sp.]MDW7612824.1 phosphate regulon sensor histidine kinase PhoR [Candidatus Nitrotoga sp.]MDW7625821.1 phosphate regulon sensor histidine kinase PhoR [Candidatus Nitrotoga sp.]
MFNFWRRALLYPFVLLLISWLLWETVGSLFASLFLSALLLVYAALHLRQLAALDYWLDDLNEHIAPDGAGLWGEIFARLNKMIRRHRKERAQRIAALQHMEQAISALPEGVTILDEAYRIEWCNLLAEQHFGLDCSRDIGQQITYLARQPELIQYIALREFAEPLILRGASQAGLILSIKLIVYGGNKLLLISRDVTQLERIEVMRRDFVANVSHELRTPLTVVGGFIETLGDMPNLENDMARKAIQLMGEQTQRMGRLVADLLTLSKLEDTLNALQEDTVDVPALLRMLCEEGESLSAKRHVLRLGLMSEHALLGSAEELRSAFGNLISNAICYTPQGGTILVSWHEQGDQLVFSVQDSGIGIAPQHIPRLTERFYRVDHSRSRETGGTGLGLAIVKHIAGRHHARLEIVSEEGAGSTFKMVFSADRRLPLATSE